MRRTLPGQFPGIGYMNDSWANSVAGNTSGWTQGSTSMALLRASSVGGQRAKLLSVSIRGKLYIQQGLQYGKLGRIIGGLSLEGPAQSGWGGGWQDFRFPMQQLPTDSSLLGPLWDPAVDPLPPSTNNSEISPYLPVSVTISPPVPLDMISQQDIGIGVWITPSLVGPQTINGSNVVTALVLFGLQYMATYDDGY